MKSSIGLQTTWAISCPREMAHEAPGSAYPFHDIAGRITTILAPCHNPKRGSCAPKQKGGPARPPFQILWQWPQRCVALVTSTDTPGPIEELTETFLR